MTYPVCTSKQGGYTAPVPLFERLDAALRKIRKDRGLTQGSWAEAAEVSLGSVNRYERGRLPDLAVLGQLLESVDADLHDLQDALDEVTGRERRRRPPAKVDQVALARLRLRYPDAPQHLLVERAQVEQELADALARADRLQRELETSGARDVAEPVAPYGGGAEAEPTEAEKRDALERTRRAIATRKGMTPREGTND